MNGEFVAAMEDVLDLYAVKGVDKTYHCGGGMLYHLGDA